MEALNQSARQFVLDILKDVHDLSLATVRPDGYPQATTVSYCHDGLTLYIGVGLDGQKAHNIQHCNKVSLTVTPPYRDWSHIKGVSIGGIAELVNDLDESRHIAECMLRRFPQINTQNQGAATLPWSGAVFVKISPQVISVLDYEKGFGHAELYAVSTETEQAT